MSTCLHPECVRVCVRVYRCRSSSVWTPHPKNLIRCKDHCIISLINLTTGLLPFWTSGYTSEGFRPHRPSTTRDYILRGLEWQDLQHNPMLSCSALSYLQPTFVVNRPKKKNLGSMWKVLFNWTVLAGSSIGYYVLEAFRTVTGCLTLRMQLLSRGVTCAIVLCVYECSHAFLYVCTWASVSVCTRVCHNHCQFGKFM